MRSRVSKEVRAATILVFIFLAIFATPMLSYRAIAAANFQVSAVAPEPPEQLQEGSAIDILINVTGGELNTVYNVNVTIRDPANQSYSRTISLSNTTTTGRGSNSTKYRDDFPGAHTDLVGVYNITLRNPTTGEMLDSSNFSIGLTDRLEYRRTETVSIRGSGYLSYENVTINIQVSNADVTGYPKTVVASDAGIVTHTWEIPPNATPASYVVTLVGANTTKTPVDAQEFTVLGALCQVRTVNLAGQGVGDVSVEVYNAIEESLISSERTNGTGWARFFLNAGNYSFRAFVKDVEVGRLENQSIVEDSILTMRIHLLDVQILVETENGDRVPFIEVTLKYNYTTRNNQTFLGTRTMQTNRTGMAETQNTLTNTSYLFEVRRYGYLFSNISEFAEWNSTSPWIRRIIVPTYKLEVHVVDSKDNAIKDVQIRVYEWTAGTRTVLTNSTDSQGNVSFSLVFGRYVLQAFDGSLSLNQTLVNLIENPQSFTFHLVIVNMNATVTVQDYFGQPIANAWVKIERKIDSEYVGVYNGTTKADGSATFNDIIGGDSRINVYLSGRLSAVRSLYLAGESQTVTFQMSEYVSIGGHPVEAGLFVVLIFLSVTSLAALIASRRRIYQTFRSVTGRD